MLLTVENICELLPKVGDRLMLTPSHRELDAPEACIVEYVHAKHRWFMVRFESTGFRNCYKVPLK